MLEVLNSVNQYLHEFHLVSVLFRLVLAMILGGILGMERGRKRRPAGFRTYMTVCIASALVMCTSEYMTNVFNTGDPARLGAQAVSYTHLNTGQAQPQGPSFRKLSVRQPQSPVCFPVPFSSPFHAVRTAFMIRQRLCGNGRNKASLQSSELFFEIPPAHHNRDRTAVRTIADFRVSRQSSRQDFQLSLIHI